MFIILHYIHYNPVKYGHAKSESIVGSENTANDAKAPSPLNDLKARVELFGIYTTIA